MKSRALILVVLCVLALSSYFIPLAYADPLGPDLDVTAGGSGAWQSDGYYFGGTAYATQSGFKPLNSLSAVTIVIWFITPSSESFQILASQRVDSTHNCRVYIDGSFQVQCQIANGVAIGVIAPGTWGYEETHFIVLRWDKTANSGKCDVFLDTSGTLYKRTSPTGLTSDISANTDLMVGKSTSTGGEFEGTLLNLAIYRSKLDNSTISSLYSAGSNYWDSSAWQEWLINEGSGALFTQGENIWHDTQSVGVGFEFSVLFPPAWHLTQSVIFVVFTQIFQGSVNALVVLGGVNHASRVYGVLSVKTP